ncbi:IMP dehydrogenase, partial [Candidatus Gottesmanbacteria bacterium]|nr:IMP dehydrogenase [Candidatus Gottesmanbacteria bacterium]
MKTIPLGLTYDDVLLVPQKSAIRSRADVVTKTKLSKNITLAIPFVSSNIDTVTESAMAIAMAKLGGMGVIHRFMPIERQVEEVTRVKRSEGFIMGTPFTLSPGHTVARARAEMKRHRVSSAIIVDGTRKVLGLVSERDMWFEVDEGKLMKTLMTSASKLINADVRVTLKEARAIFKTHKIEKLPLLNTDGTLGG